jgi:hypothetical protein
MTNQTTDAGASASRLLQRERDALAYAVTDALYAESPALLERHGERGREKCLQDMYYNIDQLIPAVDLGDGAMFARYVEWLNDMLTARNVATRDIVRCLEILREECASRFPRAESDVIGTIIGSGLQVLAT